MLIGNPITSNEYNELAHQLDMRHAIFYTFWKMGYPVFDESIETAAVGFDRDGNLLCFKFNPIFWNSLDEYTKIAIICHEALHVILNHGVRIKDTKNPRLANIALDIVVNHLLISTFNFDRNKIQNQEKLCWIDTVFPGRSDILADQNFEYYYSKLIDVIESNGSSSSNKKGGLGGDLDSWDNHDFLSDISDNAQEVIGKMDELLSDAEKESVQDIIEKNFQEDSESNPGGQFAGTNAGNIWTFANIPPVKPKKKWETVIKQWSKKYDKADDKEIEQWARVNRRFCGLSSDLFLPTEMEIEHEIEGKIDVWFFQDTSGSCYQYRDRFFKAASTLDKNRFNIRLFCFDTRVYETSFESKKLYGFGGTCFRIIETHIQKLIKEENIKKHPTVWVISDGYGTSVYPQMAKNWYVFLSTNYRNCFPKECNIFQLKDYE